MNRIAAASLAVFGSAAGIASANPTFLATFGDTLFRYDAGSDTLESFTLSDRIISATARSDGSFLMFSRGLANEPFQAYELSGALGATPQLVELATGLADVPSGVTEVGGQLFGVRDGSLYTYDSGTFAETLVGSLGLAGDAASTGSLAYDAGSGTLYMVARDDNLYEVNQGTGAASLVGGTGADLFNSGLEFLGADLFGAIFDDVGATLSLGGIDTSGGAFTSLTSIDVSGLLGTGPLPPVSLLVVPAPGTLALAGLGVLGFARRRR